MATYFGNFFKKALDSVKNDVFKDEPLLKPLEMPIDSKIKNHQSIHDFCFFLMQIVMTSA